MGPDNGSEPDSAPVAPNRHCCGATFLTFATTFLGPCLALQAQRRADVPRSVWHQHRTLRLLILLIILSMGIENGTFLGTENGTLPRRIETGKQHPGYSGGNGAGPLPDLDAQSVCVRFGQRLGQPHCQLAVSQGRLERTVLPNHRDSCLAAIGP